jgi:hypothetical protein
MERVLLSLGVVGLAIGGLAVACSDSPSAAAVDETDGGARATVPNAPRDGSASDAIAPSTAVRFAHIAPFGPIDFCYRRAATDEFVGPLFGPSDGGTTANGDANVVDDSSAPDTDSGDAAVPDDAAGDTDAAAADAGAFEAGGQDAATITTTSGGIDRLTVTRYWPLEGAGVFSFIIVAGGDTSCASPIATGDVTLEAGRYSTLVVSGKHVRIDGGADASADAGGGSSVVSALSVAAFVDDTSVQTGKARVRVIHAAFGDDPGAPVGPLSVAAFGADGTTPLAARVDPGSASSTGTVPTVDGRGYVSSVSAADPLSLHFEELVDAGGRSWSTLPARLGMTADSIHTALVGSEGTLLRVLWCDDVANAIAPACDPLLAQ